MKVFLSWSGNRSREVASLLNSWLSCVIQAVRPWISTRDIERGAVWFSEINNQLGDTVVGIVCLTQENKEKPWILFEAGALAKGLTTARVCTFLIDLEPRDIQDPLAQFNHTKPDKDGLWSLVLTLNSALGSAGLNASILQSVFDTYWPQFEEKFNEIIAATPAAEPTQQRGSDEILAEILENTRSLQSRVRKMEQEYAESKAYWAEGRSKDYRNKIIHNAMKSDVFKDVLRTNEQDALTYKAIIAMLNKKGGDSDDGSKIEG